jgi:hypothetical protein
MLRMAGFLGVVVIGILASFFSILKSASTSFGSPAPDGFEGLRSVLSSNAGVYFPGSEGYSTATDRWVEWENPHFDVVVEVGCEEDVANTVSARTMTIGGHDTDLDRSNTRTNISGLSWRSQAHTEPIFNWDRSNMGLGFGCVG